MKCKKIKKLYFDYLDGILKSEERKEFEYHLENCSECKSEFEVVKKFYENIEMEQVKAPSNMVLRIKEEIDKSNYTGFLQSVLGKILYPATIVIGLMFGIIVANLLYTPDNIDKSITLLSSNTIVVEPLINLEGGIDEQ